ncbi:rhodanese-like domain-containing protein [Salinimicrobium flavum]|uniref:Rhodanese-like domain-containing protein n=1 Tax=Salinimicrobium flavum TaxID=1737065 RepID=A0ABW5IXA5_9FLAO
MKKLNLFWILFFVSMATFGNVYVDHLELRSNPPDEFTTLVEFLEGKVDFIKGDFPIIAAEEVKKNLKNDTYHIIDIRSDSWFEYGHIKNAVNVPAEDLLNYFKSEIVPADFEKIILICYSGQSAAYYSGLLRIAGYDNVYSMKWGMSSWREDFADAWLKNTKSSFEDKLETTLNTKPASGTPPQINTGKSEGKEILDDRLQKLFAVPYNNFILNSEDIFEKPGDYFIVNYGKTDDYNLGHIPGAILYNEGSSLLSDTDLLTLPKDKKVALYTTTGQEAAYLIAYLNVLGFDTGNIAYGENSFMNDLLKKNGRDAFSSKQINLFPVIE